MSFKKNSVSMIRWVVKGKILCSWPNVTECTFMARLRCLEQDSMDMDRRVLSRTRIYEHG